jgi:hypothetical protein
VVCFRYRPAGLSEPGDQGLHPGDADVQLLGDGGVGASLCHEADDLQLPPGERVQRVADASAAEQLLDDNAVDDQLATGDSVDRVQELLDAAGFLLEEVASAFAQPLRHLGGVLGFSVLRQQDQQRTQTR